jgi:hypothetical protein
MFPEVFFDPAEPAFPAPLTRTPWRIVVLSPDAESENGFRIEIEEIP